MEALMEVFGFREGHLVLVTFKQILYLNLFIQIVLG